jgi:hypothetical protein
MKAIKLILSVLFLFPTAKGFCQTIDDTNICASTGSLASFTVNESAETYVWQMKSPDSVNWTEITSSNASTVYLGYDSTTLNITKSATLPVTGTLYRVIVNDGLGNLLTSNVATLTVVPKPVSTKITVESPVICAGGSKTLTYGTGSVGDIQWESSTTGDPDDFYPIDGETDLIYKATGLQETTWFRVKNTSGEDESCDSPYSDSTPVKVVVNLAVAGKIIRDDEDKPVCQTSNSTPFTLYDSVGTIQWKKALDLGRVPEPDEYSAIPNAISETYTAKSLKVNTYFIAVVSSGVCPSETTTPILITVDPTPVSKTITGATPACIGGSKVLVYGTGSVVGDIQWQSSTTDTTEEPDDFSDITRETERTYTATDLQETTWFRVMNSSGECDPVFSRAVKVVVENSNAGKIEGGNSIVSKKSNETELTLKDYTGAIQWQKAASLTDEFTNIPLSTSSTYITTGLTETTYFRTLVSNGDCSAVASDPVVVNVDSEFKALAYPNPFETEFNINLTPQSTDPIELKIYDMLGRLIENHYVKSSEINSMRMGTTYPSGFFTVLIKQGQQERNVKVLKK